MLNFIVSPLTQLILFFYAQTGSVGFSILLLTVALRLVLLPLSVSNLKTQKKMRVVQPKLKALEKKHADSKDKTALRTAQMELYREHGINPLAGLLPSLIQFIPLIAVYQVLQHFLVNQEVLSQGGTFFLGFDLTQRDHTYILPILAAAFSLIQSLMILPGLEHHDLIPENSTDAKVKKANEKEEKNQDAAASIQKQMVFTMPIMTGLFAIGFPAGLALYWITTTIFGIIQQYFFTGWGGLGEYLMKFGLMKKPSPKTAVPDVTNLAEALQLVESQSSAPKKKQPKKKKAKGKRV